MSVLVSLDPLSFPEHNLWSSAWGGHSPATGPPGTGQEGIFLPELGGQSFTESYAVRLHASSLSFLA